MAEDAKSKPQPERFPDGDPAVSAKHRTRTRWLVILCLLVIIVTVVLIVNEVSQ